MRTRRFFTRALYALIVLSITCLLPGRAAAWGDKGHQIIARVATDRLSNSARKEIASLLEEGETLESVSGWADQVRLHRSWHSIEISVNVGDYLQSRDCPRGVCIIEAIEDQKAKLKDPKATPAERADALKFLVHLIGDLHQPFHVTTNDNPDDNGATLVRVESTYGARNLHAAWDSDIVEYGLKRLGLPIAQYAADLGERSRKGQGIYSAQGSVVDWALEAHRAAPQAYMLGKDFMVANRGPWKLDDNYFRDNRSLAENQLFQAGVRLAKTLNDIFG